MDRSFPLAIVLMSFTGSASADFGFDRFTSGDDFTFVGSAKLTQARLRLTESLESQVGAAWLKAKQAVAGGFEVSFTYSVSGPYNGFGSADGMAFVIQNERNDAIGNNGGGLGYESVSNCLAIELRHYDGRQLSVQTNGVGPNGIGGQFSLGSMEIPEIADGRAHTVKIVYESSRMTISFDARPVLDLTVDLAETLELDAGKAWLGFTAGTGGAYATHDVLSWSYYRGQNSQFRRGDADGAGDFVITDAIKVLSHLFVGNSTLDCLDAADANDDGALDVSDPIGMLSFLFLGGFAPPSPFNECGSDPPTDDLDCLRYDACE